MDSAPSLSSACNAPQNVPSKPPTTSQPTEPALMVQLTTDGVPKLHCPICDKALISLNGYVKHLKKHEPPGGFCCRYCDARFCTEDDLKKHRDAQHTTIACRICKDQQLTFASEDEYRDHIRSAHNGIDREIFKCDKCGAEYKTPEPFKRHQENKCGTIKPHKCDECEMAFYTKYNLKQHKILHSGERQFCCSYCGKNFLQKGRLVEHERSHTGEKPYKCDVCGKCFAHRESIVTHSTIHTGIKLVECPCCSSRFSCYSNLIKHRRSRPETCGLPDYNPPKNRVRTHRPRIPPTVNPTSEIKVSHMNKIIKPSDKINEKKGRMASAPSSDGVESKPKATRGGKRGGRRKRQSKVIIKDETTTDDDNSGEREISSGKSFPLRVTREKKLQCGEAATKQIKNDSDDDEVGDSGPETTAAFSTTTAPAPSTSATSASTPSASTPSDSAPSASKTVTAATIKADRKPIWSDDSDSVEDFPNFEPESDDSHTENEIKLPLPLPLSGIKQEQPEDATTTPASLTDQDFVNTNNFINADLTVKSEDEQNIFNEKDKLIDCLLNEGETTQSGFGGGAQQKLPTFDVVKVEESVLDESEVNDIKDEEHMEDILSCNNLSLDFANECKIILEDVTLRFPKLKEKTSIKISREVKPSKHMSPSPSPSSSPQPHRRSRRRRVQNQDEKEIEKPKRKYRKRCEMGEEDVNESRAPKRTAKISQSEVKERLKLMKKDQSWQCPHCVKFYYIRKPFEKHLREEHKLSDDEMKKIFGEEQEIAALDEEVFRCQICSKIYLLEKRLLAHIKLHGPDGSLIHKCPCYCALYFATKEEAQEHAREKHKELLYCEICNKFMTGHDSLKNHRAMLHKDDKAKQSAANRANNRNLVCDKCGKKYYSRTSLTDHIRSDCGRKPIYSCEICGKCLTTAGILKTHMLLHKDETPYQCDQCGKTFKVKAQYKSHLKTRHTDYKPYKCHLCPKEYPYRESLLTHMTVHTGIKRFLCNGCGKRFTCISNLQAHRKVHADTCGVLPLNAKATQYMGVQKGNLLMGSKPEAGVDYKDTNTMIAREVIDRDLPMATEDIHYPSEPCAPLTQPLNYTQPPMAPAPQLLLPPLMMPPFVADAHPSY